MFTSGMRDWRYSEEPGRGWRPVPGVTGEYHSAMPLKVSLDLCRNGKGRGSFSNHVR